MEDDPLNSLPEDLTSLSTRELRCLVGSIERYNQQAGNRIMSFLQSSLLDLESKLELLATKCDSRLDFAKTIHSTIALYFGENWKLSLDCLSWASKVFQKHDENQWLAMTQMSAANLCINLENISDAEQKLLICRKVLKQVEEWDPSHPLDSEKRYKQKILYEADVLCELARVQIREPEMAEITFRECFDLINHLPYGVSHLKAYVEYAEFCSLQGWAKEAVKILKKCLVKAEEDGRFRMTFDECDREDALMNINCKLGEAYFHLRDFENAERHYRNAIRFESAIQRRGSSLQELRIHSTLLIAVIARYKFKEGKKLLNKLSKKVRKYEKRDEDLGEIKKMINLFKLQMKTGKSVGKERWEKEVVPMLCDMVFPKREIPQVPKHVKKMYKMIDKEKECANCMEKRPINQLKTCGRCRKVLYCGADCQKQHWKLHKKECKGKKKTIK